MQFLTIISCLVHTDTIFGYIIVHNRIEHYHLVIKYGKLYNYLTTRNAIILGFHVQGTRCPRQLVAHRLSESSA